MSLFSEEGGAPLYFKDSFLEYIVNTKGLKVGEKHTARVWDYGSNAFADFAFRVEEKTTYQYKEETVASPEGKADRIVWVESYAKGMEEAKKAGKPMMIDLYADWCGPCRMLDEQVWTDARVIEAAAGYVCVKVDVDKDAATADKYRASAIPLVVFAHSDGTVMNRSVGLVPADKMLALMKSTSGK